MRSCFFCLANSLLYVEQKVNQGFERKIIANGQNFNGIPFFFFLTKKLNFLPKFLYTFVFVAKHTLSKD